MSPMHYTRERTPRRPGHPECERKLEIGGYIRTRDDNPRIKCKAYDGPPDVDGGGNYICTFSPGERLGPITKILYSSAFHTVEIEGGWWINTWSAQSRAKGTFYAHPAE